MNNGSPTLISTKEALKILTWVSYSGLLIGAKGTNALTRYPHGVFSKEECEELRLRMIEQGARLDDSKKLPVRIRARYARAGRECPAELI
jgi:hypothetical protein